MRIAFVSYEFPPDTGKGGIGTYVSQIASALARQKNDVHIFAGGNTTENVFQNLYHLHKIKCDDSFDFREKVVSVFEECDNESTFDIIESPEINGNAWEIKQAFPQIKLIVRLHAPNHLVETLKKRYVTFLQKIRFVAGALRKGRFDLGYWRSYNKNTDPDYNFIQLADYITAPSVAMKNWAIKTWNIPGEKITVIPNIFIPAPAFLNLPVNEKAVYKTIAFFGRLNALKGLVNGSKAVKKILKQYPDWKFKVIGDDGLGPYTGISMRQWMQNALNTVIGNVNFSNGKLYEEIPESIKEAEIILLPSLFESFSYTCIEAMAAGKAVVGSKSGGMTDLLQDHKSGLLIDPENVDEIYKALKELIDDNALRYYISVNARQRVLTDYNESLITKQNIDYYKQIISG